MKPHCFNGGLNLRAYAAFPNPYLSNAGEKASLADLV